ncbi:MAG: hypothetical protein ACLR4Z_01575 [Butyricicoccaceae bacterium]
MRGRGLLDARQPSPCSMKTARSSRRPSLRASSFRSKRFVLIRAAADCGARRGAKYDVMARNTADAMRVAAVIGAAAMVDGLIGRYAAVLGKTPRVWLTGDCCQLIAPHLRSAGTARMTLFLRDCGSFGAKTAAEMLSFVKILPCTRRKKC